MKVSASARNSSRKKKLKLPTAHALDLAAVQTTWAQMQSDEQRNDPQGFAVISNTGMMLINATLLESLLGEAPGTLAR